MYCCHFEVVISVAPGHVLGRHLYLYHPYDPLGHSSYLDVMNTLPLASSVHANMDISI